MKNSDNLWEKSTSPAPADPPRRSFALKGRSIHLDPRHNAVRADLADIRLAEYVFAPHYAAPMRCTLAKDAALRLGPDASSEVLAELRTGEEFEVLEIFGELAWGVSPDRRLAGYAGRDALERNK